VLLFVTVLIRGAFALLGELLFPSFCAAFALLCELSFAGEKKGEVLVAARAQVFLS
jgi:hypothetical protein